MKRPRRVEAERYNSERGREKPVKRQEIVGGRKPLGGGLDIRRQGCLIPLFFTPARRPLGFTGPFSRVQGINLRPAEPVPTAVPAGHTLNVHGNVP